MQDLRLEGKDVYLCSFDISSLFTNVTLKETIGICAEALHKDPSSAPPTPKAIYRMYGKCDVIRSVQF